MEFFKWYSDQVEKKVKFDFREEKQVYCHSDAYLLRLYMQKFRNIFRELKKEDELHIGAYPFNCVTIAKVAFNGIYCTHFLPPQTIITLPRPSKANHSFKQILWMEYEASKPSQPFIQHARNAGEYQVTLCNGKKVSVDGFCRNTNTIFQFHSCFWHGCPYCYCLFNVLLHHIESRSM